MSVEILIGYSAGIITIAAISLYPENFKPPITENPRPYLLVGCALLLIALCIEVFQNIF